MFKNLEPLTTEIYKPQNGSSSPLTKDILLTQDINLQQFKELASSTIVKFRTETIIYRGIQL